MSNIAFNLSIESIVLRYFKFDPDVMSGRRDILIMDNRLAALLRDAETLTRWPFAYFD